jgi:hypothetical protein
MSKNIQTTALNGNYSKTPCFIAGEAEDQKFCS